MFIVLNTFDYGDLFTGKVESCHETLKEAVESVNVILRLVQKINLLNEKNGSHDEVLKFPLFIKKTLCHFDVGEMVYQHQEFSGMVQNC